MAAKRVKPKKATKKGTKKGTKKKNPSTRPSGSLRESGTLRGLWYPFLAEAGGDVPGGRRVPVLLWEGGVFTSVELPPDTSGRSPLERGLLDAAIGLTLPGLVCGHVEPVQALFAGFPRAGTGIDERAGGERRAGSRPGGRTADRERIEATLTREDVSAAASLCAAEAALAGVTTVYVLHRAPFFEGVLDVYADAFRVVGVRLVAAADVDERAAGADGARGAMRENVRFAKVCAEREDGMSAAMAGLSHPDALPTLLAEMVGEARRAELSFHLVLLDPPESRRRLAEKGALRSGSVAVVGAALDEEERALLRDLEVFPVADVRADVGRGSVPPPLRGLARHLVYGGLDGSPDVLAERDAFAATCALLPEAERIASWRPLANGWNLAAATFDLNFGRWSSGAPADLVVFDEAIPGELTPASLRTHLDRASARHVRHVVVAGKTVVKDGKLTNVDEGTIRTEARNAASAAWRRAGKKA